MACLIGVLFFSSCKPRYMRCPKKRSCSVQSIKINYLKNNTPINYIILAEI